VLDAARAWAADEPRVRALLLKGSLGRGGGDERSDLDLVIVAESGRRDELWAERRAIAERLGRPLGLFRDVALWEPPNLAIALYAGPLKVDLFFQDGEVEPSGWLLEGFEALVDKDEVGAQLRARLESFRPRALDPLHDDLAELDAHAWDFALWLDRKLELGERWAVYLELPHYAEWIVLTAWNALAGEGWRGSIGVATRIDPGRLARLEGALPRGTEPGELRRSIRALVELYVEARPLLSERLGQPLEDELMRGVRGRIG
jgi:predicted nucleotidyltransferase